ncbi:hypothetical protein [Halalkalibacter urbisdiaboli]|uniref:hypothetical protein n=1 Tax=Halalkalibacter urbisdiaboli TaxID=1960589 RepID=UPI000B44071C|nr:hypothetical protein [Halalkalibacter urbisdiaboli]
MKLIGTMLVNLLFGIFSACIVFVSSLSANLAMTSFVRSLIAFVIGWLIAYVFRVVWSYVTVDLETATETNTITSDTQEENEQQVKEIENELSLDKEMYNPEQVSDYVKDLLNSKS